MGAVARKRKPSISLIVLFVILLLLFFFAAQIVELVSEWSGYGSFTYSYPQGHEAIVEINYDLPQKLADSMAVKETEGWNVSLNGKILSLTGGTLNPGEAVAVTYKLKSYIPGGANTITVTGVTETGSELTSQSVLHIPDIYLLYIAELLFLNPLWLLILAIIVLVIIILLFIKGEKKEEVVVRIEPAR